MSEVIIRYKLRPGEVDETLALLRAFFDALETENPPGLVYETYILDDGLSFLHHVVSGADAQPFGNLPSYRRFRDTIAARCSEPPEMTGTTPVGKFNSLAE